MPPCCANAREGRAVQPRVGLVGHTASPIWASRTFGKAPTPPSRNLLSLYQELGPSRHFPLATSAESPQQLQNNITSLYDLWCSHATNPLSSTFYINADGLIICLIWASIEEVMHVQTLAISGATPRPLLYQGAVPRQRPTQIAISLSSHLKLRCFWAFYNQHAISYA